MEDISFAQKITFVLIQGTSLFFLFGFATSLASSGLLSSSNISDKEMQAAKKTAFTYVVLSIALWLLNWLVGY